MASRAFTKVCGLRDVEHAAIAAAAGADALGFVLARSRRRVHASLIMEVRAHLTNKFGLPRLVAVVVNERADQLQRIVESAHPDVVQFSGDEDPSVLDCIGTPAFRTIRVPVGSHIDEVRTMIDPWLDHACPVEAVLIEAYSEGQFGGTGKVSDWEFAAVLAETYPVILAGGLTPETVGAGIEMVRPLGVDVSSGVEVDGDKNPERIRAFISQARNAFTVTESL